MSGFERRTVLAGLSVGLLLSASRVGAASSPIVRTRDGPVRGYADGGVSVFKGIPYGADTGPRRFRPPAPPQPWTDAREALAYGPASPQSRGAGPTSEDCLYLNVWTPSSSKGALRDNARRPVMVYIHGGAYSTGSARRRSTTACGSRDAATWWW